MNALVNGYIRRYELNEDNTIESALINGEYKLDCETYNITTENGSVSITETQYKQLMSNIQYNMGNIKITNSFYGDGILFNKTVTTKNSNPTLRLVFLILKYKTFD